MRSKTLALTFFQLSLVSLARPQLTVDIKDEHNFCLVVPKNYNIPIGDSEYPGGMTVWCQGESTPGSTGTFQSPFWTNVEVSRPKAGVIQVSSPNQHDLKHIQSIGSPFFSKLKRLNLERDFLSFFFFFLSCR